MKWCNVLSSAAGTTTSHLQSQWTTSIRHLFFQKINIRWNQITVNEAKNENQINWLHEALAEVQTKPHKQREEKNVLLLFIKFIFQRTRSFSENCHFQSGVAQIYLNRRSLKIKEFTAHSKQSGWGKSSSSWNCKLFPWGRRREAAMWSPPV